MMPFLLKRLFCLYRFLSILEKVPLVLFASSNFLLLKYENWVLAEIRCCVILCQIAILPRHPELNSDLSVTNTARWAGSEEEINVGDFGLTVSR